MPTLLRGTTHTKSVCSGWVRSMHGQFSRMQIGRRVLRQSSSLNLKCLRRWSRLLPVLSYSSYSS